MHERLRETHPRIGKAAFEAWDAANPLITAVLCPTCTEPFPQPLRIEFEGDPFEDVSTFFGPRTYARHRIPHIVCPLGHRWTLATFHHRECEVYRISLGHYIGQEAPSFALW